MAGGVESGFEIDAEIVEQMRKMGAPAEVIAKAEEALRHSDFELQADCEQAFAVFSAMRTQWRRAGMDGLLSGLDYAGLPFVMRMMAVKAADRPQVFQDVRLMELETLSVQASRQAAK